jgi:hypothetical protein
LASQPVTRWPASRAIAAMPPMKVPQMPRMWIVHMFASQPADLIANRAFVVKIGLVMLAGLNAAAFHARGGLRRLDAFARAQTIVSLGLWLTAMICGRWIAYL